ncbi:hypothetical protein PTKIN_Ptkin16aG0095500 [Pterospermum kingtungense]
MVRFTDFVAIYILLLLCLNICTHSFCYGVHKFTCIESEKQALLKFKHDLKDPSNMLANWTSTGDCCHWVGVVCNNLTGHVSELHLANGLLASMAKTEAHVWSKLGGKLNPSLLDLKHLSYLDISGHDFKQIPIPPWFWNLTSHLHYLNISGNQFQGNIPDLLTTGQESVVLDFSFNNFTGRLPRMSFNATAFDLSNNAMSGSISHFLCYRMYQQVKLEVLILSNNLFTGEIPDCWEKWPSLVAINFCNNNFIGKIPGSLGNLTSLQSLHLRSNSLVGEVPSSLRDCTELLTIDLGANQLSGQIPPWMGEKLSKLIIISLQTNWFHGPIPDEICCPSSLQILDLSQNSLSGNVPSCISNLSAMVSSRSVSAGKLSYNTSYGCFYESMEIVMKGMVIELSTVLRLIFLVDLSYNKLSGEIPEALTSLTGLRSLNLSHNHLNGRIPDNIGAMTNLESVDLSANNLSGEIPNSMPDLSFLSYLNLSYNNLTGQIPQSNQFQTFSADSFRGNNLYGPPLNVSRIVEPPTPSYSVGENGDNDPKVNWLYLCVEFGFLFGFVGVAHPILFTDSWDFLIINFWNKLQISFGLY